MDMDGHWFLVDERDVDESDCWPARSVRFGVGQGFAGIDMILSTAGSSCASISVVVLFGLCHLIRQNVRQHMHVLTFARVDRDIVDSFVLARSRAVWLRWTP